MALQKYTKKLANLEWALAIWCPQNQKECKSISAIHSKMQRKDTKSCKNIFCSSYFGTFYAKPQICRFWKTL